MNKNNFFGGGLMLLLGAALTIAVLFYLPQCHAAHPMKCNWMVRAVAYMGFQVAVLGLILQCVKNAAMAFGIQLAQFLNGLGIVALATFVIGPCNSPMMHCHTETQPIVVVWGLVISLVALFSLVCLKKRMNKLC